MTDREQQFAALGFEYVEGMEQASEVIMPTGRKILRTTQGTWNAPSWKANDRREFDDLLEAVRFATRRPFLFEFIRGG